MDKYGKRRKLPFRSVNCLNKPGYQPNMQRHHLLPRQLLSQKHFRNMFHALGTERIGFDDFRFNGLLLPANEQASIRLAMPLHRGPHRTYNEVVAERIGQIEMGWSRMRSGSSDKANDQAMMRIGLLQSALRRRLLEQRRSLLLPWARASISACLMPWQRRYGPILQTSGSPLRIRSLRATLGCLMQFLPLPLQCSAAQIGPR